MTADERERERLHYIQTSLARIVEYTQVKRGRSSLKYCHGEDSMAVLDVHSTSSTAMESSPWHHYLSEDL